MSYFPVGATKAKKKPASKPSTIQPKLYVEPMKWTMGPTLAGVGTFPGEGFPFPGGLPGPTPGPGAPGIPVPPPPTMPAGIFPTNAKWGDVLNITGPFAGLHQGQVVVRFAGASGVAPALTSAFGGSVVVPRGAETGACQIVVNGRTVFGTNCVISKGLSGGGLPAQAPEHRTQRAWKNFGPGTPLAGDSSMSYGDDGSSYTRGVGAVASLDRGASSAKGGGAVKLPNALRAVTHYAKPVPAPAPLVIVDQPIQPARVYGQTVPWPVGNTSAPVGAATPIGTSPLPWKPNGVAVSYPPAPVMPVPVPVPPVAPTLPVYPTAPAVPPVVVATPPPPGPPVFVPPPAKKGSSTVLIVGGVLAGAAILYFMVKKR